MIGSETFIMVALRCSDSSTPFALASAIDAAKNSRSARRLMADAPMTSPSSTATSLSTLDPPVAASTNSIATLPAAPITADCSLP